MTIATHPEIAEKILTNVPALAWGRGKDCTFAGALEAAMAATEHPCSYIDLMGFSGLAFRVRWFKPKYGIGACCSCAVGEMEEATAAIAHATGWPLRVEFHGGESNLERFVPDIVASIDAGKPVVAYDDHLDMAVIHGYARGGGTLLFRDYHKGEKRHELPASKLGWLWFYLGEYEPALTTTEAVIEGLRIAVRNWRRVSGREGPGEYWYGHAAYDAWCAILAQLEELGEHAQRNALQTNYFAFMSLLDARKAAVLFLRERGDLLPAKACAAVYNAADIYEREFVKLQAKEQQFLSPGTIKEISDWTQEIRKRECSVLRLAKKFEELAIEQLEEALAHCFP
jgi:hypothetical protein